MKIEQNNEGTCDKIDIQYSPKLDDAYRLAIQSRMDYLIQKAIDLLPEEEKIEIYTISQKLNNSNEI